MGVSNPDDFAFWQLFLMNFKMLSRSFSKVSRILYLKKRLLFCSIRSNLPTYLAGSNKRPVPWEFLTFSFVCVCVQKRKAGLCNDSFCRFLSRDPIINLPRHRLRTTSECLHMGKGEENPKAIYANPLCVILCTYVFCREVKLLKIASGWKNFARLIFLLYLLKAHFFLLFSSTNFCDFSVWNIKSGRS